MCYVTNGLTQKTRDDIIIDRKSKILTIRRGRLFMENTLVLEFIGRDDFSYKTYKTEDGKILKDVGNGNGTLELCTCTMIDDWWGDAEPNMPIEKVDRYKGLKIVIKGEENEPSPSDRFNYMMLGRLKSDCDYYLGNGNRYEGHLWAKNATEQIEEMKRIWNTFDSDKKPEWLTMADIKNYEKAMVDNTGEKQMEKGNEATQKSIVKKKKQFQR